MLVDSKFKMRQEQCGSKAGQMIIETIFMMFENLGLGAAYSELKS